LNRVLEGEKQSLACPLLGRHHKEVAAEIGDGAVGDLVAVTAGQHRGQGALTRAIRPHDRVYFAGRYREVDPFENFPAVREPRVQIADFEHHSHSTLPYFPQSLSKWPTRAFSQSNFVLG